jgi:hypothetical protein
MGGEGNNTHKHQKKYVKPAAYNIGFYHYMMMVVRFIPEGSQNNES